MKSRKLVIAVAVLAIFALAGCEPGGSASNDLPSWLQNTIWSGTLEGTVTSTGAETVTSSGAVKVEFSDKDFTLSIDGSDLELVDGANGVKASLDASDIKYTESGSSSSYILNVPTVKHSETQNGVTVSAGVNMRISMSKISETEATLTIDESVTATASAQGQSQTESMTIKITGTVTKQ